MPCSEGYNNDDSESLVLNMAVCPEEGYLSTVWATRIALPRIAAVAKEIPRRIFHFYHQLSAGNCGAKLIDKLMKCSLLRCRRVVSARRRQKQRNDGAQRRTDLQINYATSTSQVPHLLCI